MMTIPTAKALLFIALTVGPANPTAIYATSNSESYVWTPSATGWQLDALGFPAPDFTRDPSTDATFSGSPHKSDVPKQLRVISEYSWAHNGAVVLENGDRIEKHGDHAFYIINAGGANEKDFTIFFNTTK